MTRFGQVVAALPDGWTPWFGCGSPAGDYINGPLYLRDGTVTPPNKRISVDQWFWTTGDVHTYGTMPDDVIGYTPGFWKTWAGADEGPNDWIDGLTLWYDKTIMDIGIKRSSIGWVKSPKHDGERSSITAYVSTDVPEISATKNSRAERIKTVFDMMNSFPVLSGRVTDRQAELIVEALDRSDPNLQIARIAELENCLRVTRRLVGEASASGFADGDAITALFTNNGKITRLVPVLPEDRQKGLEYLGSMADTSSIYPD